MDSEQTPEGKSILGSIHVSISNVISYSLLTTAAMLAFFFAFQGTLIVYFSSLNDALRDLTLELWSSEIPIGKLGVSLICIVPIIFNIWAYKIVKVFVGYFSIFVESGSQIEAEVGVSNIAVFSKMLEAYNRPGKHYHLFNWTIVFFLTISMVWLVFSFLPWTA